MKYYAKIIDDVVVDTIVAEDDFMDTFTDTSPGIWIEFCNNTWGGKHHDETGNEDSVPPFRKNRASVGFTYDPVRDAFIPPKKYESFVLNEETCMWEPPVPIPDAEINFNWNEETKSWDFVSYPLDYVGPRPY